jgi:hypothetical protein
MLHPMMSFSWIMKGPILLALFLVAHWRHPAAIGTLSLEVISHHLPKTTAAYIDVLH